MDCNPTRAKTSRVHYEHLQLQLIAILSLSKERWFYEDSTYFSLFSLRMNVQINVRRSSQSHVGVHCYSTKHRVQIQFHGLAKFNESHPLFNHWRHTALQNPMDYSTLEAPGTLTDHCDTPQYDTTLASQHFIPMLVDIQEVHLLLLGTPHQRCRWVRMTNNTWLKEWLVP